jgi:hypothetical protein
MTLEHFLVMTPDDVNVLLEEYSKNGKATYKHLLEREYKGKENEFKVISFEAVYSGLIRVCVRHMEGK